MNDIEEILVALVDIGKCVECGQITLAWNAKDVRCTVDDELIDEELSPRAHIVLSHYRLFVPCC